MQAIIIILLLVTVGGGGVFGGHRGLEIAILANIVLLKFKCFSVPAVNRDFIPI